MRTVSSASLSRYLTSGLLTALIFISIGGCKSKPETMEKTASRVAVGMTPADVEKLLGPSKEVTYEELPEFYRNLLESPPQGVTPAKGTGVVYLKWIDNNKNANTTGHIAFRDGKVVDGTIYVETLHLPK